ncbi:MAG: Lrp/AsnC family transcriptional regulator [Brevibacterium aurantiacum]
MTEKTRRIADALDARILLELVRQPRSTVAGLAQRLQVARNTAQARLTRLEDEGLHSFDHRVDTAGLGYPLRAHVLANLKQRKLDQVGAELARIPEVIGVSGTADTLIQVVARDTDDLYRIAGRILSIPGVKRTRTLVSMKQMVEYRVTPLLRRTIAKR